MRPLRLELRGLRSYRQRTVVDFTDLDLFAIIGDTGAGKSTIIEALSLALYGRKTWTGGANLEELIADGENTMAIELSFLADGHRWTVTRSRHRNASAPINKLECPDLGEKLDGNKAVNERVEQLIGLDHSQFVRAVVLPQGRFDELLQSTRTDRNKILRSIFGLDDLRRVREEAVRRRDAWSTTVTEASAQRAMLPPDPVAALATATASADAAERRSLTLASAVVECAEVERRLAASARAVERLERVLAPLEPPRAAVDQLRELAARADQLIAARTRIESERNDAEQARDLALQAQTTALAGFDTPSEATIAVERLRATAATVTELDDERSVLERRHREVAELEPSDHEPAELTAAADAATQRIGVAERALADARADADAAARCWSRVLAARSAVDARRTELAEAQATADDARTAVAIATVGLERAEADLVAARNAHAAAVRANAAVAAAVGVAPGDSCPVCSQAIPAEWHAPHAGDLDSAVHALAAAESDATARQRAASAADTSLTHCNTRLSSSRQALDDALVELGAARAEATSLRLDPDLDDTDRALESSLAALGAATDERAAAGVAAEAVERQRAAAAAERHAAIAEHRRTLDSLRERLDQNGSRRAAAWSQLARLPDAWSVDPDAGVDGLDTLAGSIGDMLTEVARLTGQVAAADTTLADCRDRYAELRTEAVEHVNAPATDLVKLLEAQRRRGVELAGLLTELAADTDPGDRSPSAPAPPDSLPDAVRLDDVSDVVSVGDALVDWLTPVIADGSATLDQLSTRSSADASLLARLLSAAGADQLGSLQGEAGAARAEAARWADELGRLQSQVNAAERLDAVLVIGRPYLANLEALALTLRDQHFVDHLVGAREVELLAEATRRLKAITDGRYGFVPDFGVVRIATGEVRSPDTLSGGERFQAALALALALVEIASRGAGKLDAVFVDEGFGSLDAAALDVALDTLGSVAGGGKLVALISHLRPVAEYVDTVFSVTKDDLFGSTIELLDAEARERLLADDIRSGLTN